MVGRDVSGYSFKKQNQPVILALKSAVVIDGDDPVQVNPHLLFYRLSVVATQEGQEDPTQLFKKSYVVIPQRCLTMLVYLGS